MNEADILEYAQLAVGFPVFHNKYVIVEPVCHGIDRFFTGQSSEPYSIGRITDIKMLPSPDQLTITVEIQINEAKGISIRQRFSERVDAGDFPFRQTAADLAAERQAKAEAEEKERAKKSNEDAAKQHQKEIEDAQRAGAAAAVESRRQAALAKEKENREADPAWKEKQKALEDAFQIQGMDYYD